MSRPPAPDVAIVGGGIVGAAAAAFLSAAGARVTLFERTSIAAAASGRNSGVVQHPFDPVLAGLYRESLELYRALALDADDAAPFQVGVAPAGLVLVGDGEANETARAVAEAWQAAYPATRRRSWPGRSSSASSPPSRPASSLAGSRSATRSRPARRPEPSPHSPSGAASPFGSAGPSASRSTARSRRAWSSTDRSSRPARSSSPRDPGHRTSSTRPARWRPIRPVWGVVADVGLAEPPRHVLEELEIEIEIEPSDAERRRGRRVESDASGSAS